MNPLRFKTNMQYLRSRAKLSQEEMARALGITRSSYGSWEEGRAYPSVPKLVTLCERLGIKDITAILTQDLHQGVKDGSQPAAEITAIVRRIEQLEETHIHIL